MELKAININSTNEYDHNILKKMLDSSVDFKSEFLRCVLATYEDYKVAYKFMDSCPIMILCDESLCLSLKFDFEASTLKLKIENAKDSEMKVKQGVTSSFTYLFFKQLLEFSYKI